MKAQTILSFLLLAASATYAQDNVTCDMSTFETATATCRDTEIQRLSRAVHDEARVAEKAKVEKTAQAKAETELSKTNKATTAPDAFASRLHNSYQDFLNP